MRITPTPPPSPLGPRVYELLADGKRRTCQTNFERGIALSLHLWSDLAFAVENNLGGGDSSSKRGLVCRRRSGALPGRG